MPFARGFGPLELIIILVIVMMIFGVGKLPQVGQSMGKAIREFRKSQNDESTEEKATSGQNEISTSEAKDTTAAKDTAYKSPTH